MSEIPLSKSLTLAPDPEHVFTRPDFWSQYLMPLLSFEISDIFDDLRGPLHIIDTIEPYDGYIGGFTKAFHNYYCRENWISFKIVDGLYECEAPEDYFAKSYWKTHAVPDYVQESVREGWVQATDDYYVSTAAKYNTWRETLKGNLDEQIENHGIEFGGRPCDSNWVHSSDFPLSVDKEDVPGRSFPDKFHYPLTKDGRRFRYIGSSEAFNCRCAIHLFFDPLEQRALQTFDWT